MSSLWTPDGERPVSQSSSPFTVPINDESIALPDSQGSSSVDPGGREPTPEELQEYQREMAQLQAELLQTPAAAVVANHGYGLFELAAIHLGAQPPNLGEASLAIDSLGAIMEACGPRLGEYGEQLREGLAQLRLAFVQIKTAIDAGISVAPSAPVK